MPTAPDLEDQLDRIPDRTGVYIFRDAAGKPLYIGKARSLRSRVRAHFHAGRAVDARTLTMLNRVADIDYITTGSEVESLILESNLVKEHHPEYNLKLRDDKHFPYLRVDLQEPYPRVEVVRRMARDGARYFGPYTRSGSVRETLRTLRRLFPYRTCSDHRMRTVDRPCLDFQIRRCAGPCVAAVTPEDYRAMMEEMCLFLEGRQASLAARLKARMEEAASRLEFEKAAELRDQLRAVEDVMQRQSIISTGMEDQDAVGYAGSEETGLAAVQVFFVREGKVVGRDGFLLHSAGASRGPEVVEAFLKQHYGREAAHVPSRILVPEVLPPEEREPIEEWLTTLARRRVRIHRPLRGVARDLVRLATENAALMLREEEMRRLFRGGEFQARAAALAEVLGLPEPPLRIEGFDVSNIRGQEAVGSMVVFVGGRPAPEAYRRFRVRLRAEPDDYAMMQEVLHRRFRRLRPGPGSPGSAAAGSPGAGDSESAGEAELGDRLRAVPDLVLIDGGKGHLEAALKVLQDLGLALPVLALAKEREQVYAPGRSDPVVFPDGSPALQLLRHVRDEAHRFAVGYHRLLRRKRARRSRLDDIPGIGPVRRTALLRAFGSVAGVRAAGLEDIAAVPGIGRAAARKIWEALHEGPPGRDGDADRTEPAGEEDDHG